MIWFTKDCNFKACRTKAQRETSSSNYQDTKNSPLHAELQKLDEGHYVMVSEPTTKDAGIRRKLAQTSQVMDTLYVLMYKNVYLNTPLR